MISEDYDRAMQVFAVVTTHTGYFLVFFAVALFLVMLACLKRAGMA